ncbi:MAG: xanthine dehydrogenase family protein subunit M [Chloroflexi bacterium]|nr:xanthine dehydrogenase family protein subunit M [Chloroflexota bacterium]
MRPFDYAAPATMTEATQLLRDVAAAPLGGGTDLLPLMKDGLVEPSRLVDLRRLPGLESIEPVAGGLRLGALVTLDRIESDDAIRTGFRLLAEAASAASSPQLRNMGTLGGNLCQRPRCWYFRGGYRCFRAGGDACYAVGGENEYLAILGGDPCYIVHPSDVGPALIALDAQIALQGPDGRRFVQAEDFFVGVKESLTRETVLEPGEIVTHVELPAQPSGARGTYLKAMDRGAWSFALAAVAAQLALDGGIVRDARIVLGGVAPTPWRCPAAEQALVGATLSGTTAALAAARAVEGAQPMSRNAYKVDLARGLVERALARLMPDRGSG